MDVGSHENRIHYEVAGAGPAVLLVPGLMQAAEDWVAAGYVDALSDEFTVIVVDPLGFGTSDRPLDPRCYAFDRRVDDLVAVLDAVGVERATVWGYSFGAMQAEALAQREPGRVSGLIAGGSVLGIDSEARKNLAGPALPVLRTGDWDEVFAKVHPGLPDDSQRLFRARNDLAVVAASHEGSFEPFPAETEIFDGPTLNYAGSLEAWYPVAYAVAEARGAAFAGIEGADHAHAFRNSRHVLPVVTPHLPAHPPPRR